jgi:3-oxoadipate enol-lactonase
MPITTNGIHYEERGSGSTSVVLLPGLGCSIEAWSGVTPLLDGYRFVLLDLPGHAGSIDSEADGSSLATIAKPLIAALDELGIERFAVVGLSFGGALAVRIALDRPDQVLAAMALMPWPASGAQAGDPIMATLYDAFADEAAVTHIVELISLDPSRTTDVLHTMTSGVTEGFWRSWYGAGVYTSMLPELSGLTVPTSYMLGGRDAIAPQERLIADVAAMPGGRLVYLSDVGHLAPYESPELVAPEIAEFVGRYAD